MKTFWTMLKTELKLNIRDMNMVIFAILMPLVVLVILGLLYGGAPAFEGADYTFLEQSFGAVSTISICASGLMGLPLVVSEYRERKILKRLQVTPVRPAMLLSVQLAVYTLYSLCSLVLLYGVARLAWGVRIRGAWPAFLGGWLLVLVSMLAVGMMVGGISKDSKQAGIIASILYFPMLVFSGATLPYEIMPPALQRIAGVMPLTQGIKLVKAACLGQSAAGTWLSIAVLAGVAAVCIGVSLRWFKWE